METGKRPGILMEPPETHPWMSCSRRRATISRPGATPRWRPAAGILPLLALLLLWAGMPEPGSAGTGSAGTSTAGTSTAGTSTRLRVLAGVAPVAYLARQVGGDQVAVQVLVPAGRDPHHFEPSPREIMAATQAAVYFTVGLDFEASLARRLQASAPGLRVVSLGATTDGPTDDRPADDPHGWMAPLAAKAMAEVMAATLAELDPAHADDFRARARTLGDDLAALHNEIATRLAPYRGRYFFTIHGGFGLFARAYGLIQETIEPSGAGPGPRRLAALIRRGRQLGIRILLVQPEFGTGTARLVAKALGARLVTVDPLAPDLPATYQELATVLEQAFQP